jgi:hypothetical protein
MSMNLFYFFHGHFDISWIYVRKNVCGGTVIMIILFFWNLNFTNFHEKNTSMQLEFLIYFIF